MCQYLASCVDTFCNVWGYWLHVSTLQEHMSTLSALSEANSYMCQHFKNMCRLLIIDFLDFILCSYVLTPQFHVSTPHDSFSKLWPLSLCVDTLSLCVNYWSFIFRILASGFMCRFLKFMCWHFQFLNQIFVCVNSSNPCVDTFICRLKATVFMCRHHMIMCRYLLPRMFSFARLHQFYF